MSPIESILLSVVEPFFRVMADRVLSLKPGQAICELCAGDWHVHWVVNQPDDFEPNAIDDLITIKIYKNGKIKGKGVNPYYGEYKLSGIDMPYAMTLAYQPASGRISYPGICLILKDADLSILQGIWLQQHGKYGLLAGELTLKRPKR